MRLAADPERRGAALATITNRNLTMQGPVMLLQGFRGAVARTPVFISNVSEDNFFGCVALAIWEGGFWMGRGRGGGGAKLMGGLQGRRGTHTRVPQQRVGRQRFRVRPFGRVCRGIAPLHPVSAFHQNGRLTPHARRPPACYLRRHASDRCICLASCFLSGPQIVRTTATSATTRPRALASGAL
jgi:hypothetical protein